MHVTPSNAHLPLRVSWIALSQNLQAYTVQHLRAHRAIEKSKQVTR